MLQVVYQSVILTCAGVEDPRQRSDEYAAQRKADLAKQSADRQQMIAAAAAEENEEIFDEEAVVGVLVDEDGFERDETAQYSTLARNAAPGYVA